MKRHSFRLAAAALGLLLVLPTGLPASAASSFDAGYYATRYPDVAAACGTDEGALLQHYIQFGASEGRKPSAWGRAGDTDLKLTDDQIAILRTLKDGALQVDDLIEKTQIPTRRVLSALTMMELEGYVEQGSGKHFSLTVTLLEE